MRNKKIASTIFIIFLLLVLGYALYTARNVVLGPRLLLSVPNGTMTVTAQVIEISGAAQNTAKLELNKATILLDEHGNFTERMLLSAGVNVFIFDAEDKFGRQAQKKLQIIYTPKDDAVLELNDAVSTTSTKTGL